MRAIESLASVRPRVRTARLILLCAGLIAVPGACAPLDDPGEHVFPVVLLNDTTTPMLLGQCDSTCGQTRALLSLGPGAAVREGAYAGSVHQYWVIKTEAGEVLGCVDLSFPTKEPGKSVLLSKRTPCPASASS